MLEHQTRKYMKTNVRRLFSLYLMAIMEQSSSTDKQKAVISNSIGKTYTMLGGREGPGILHYSLLHIFNRDGPDSVRKQKIYVSYLEIYNEGLIDLLNPKGDPSSLKVKEDSKVSTFHKMGIVVANLRQQKVRNAEEALHLLQFGEEYRVFEAHFRSIE